MNRTALAIVITLGTAACSSCSSGSNSNDGGSSGSCKNVEICKVIPLADVNTGTKKMLTGSTPMSSGMGANSGDTCDYSGTGAMGGNVSLIRFCYDPASSAGTQFDSDKGEMLATGGTRTDVTGVGDRAFYQSEPTAGFPTAKVRLEVVKGPYILTASATNVAAADDAAVKTGLIGFANTLLK